jgi:hypothetical protein
MRPHVAGTDRFDAGIAYDEAQMRALYKQKAENLKDCGADLIVLEMMRDSTFSAWATDAAIDTGLPVWVGIAVERNAQGGLSGVNHPEEELGQLVKTLTARKPDACLDHALAHRHHPRSSRHHQGQLVRHRLAPIRRPVSSACLTGSSSTWTRQNLPPPHMAGGTQVRRSSVAAAASTPITLPPCRRTSLHEPLHRKLPVRRRNIRDRW